MMCDINHNKGMYLYSKSVQMLLLNIDLFPMRLIESNIFKQIISYIFSLASWLASKNVDAKRIYIVTESLDPDDIF